MQTENNLTIEKHKIWKGRSYVLKTSLVKEALAEAKTEIDTHLVYWPQRQGTIFLSQFWIPNENVPYNRIYITAGSVSSDQHKKAFEELKNKGMPAFIAWLKSILDKPKNSPTIHQEPFFQMEWRDGKMEIEIGFLGVKAIEIVKTI